MKHNSFFTEQTDAKAIRFFNDQSKEETEIEIDEDMNVRTRSAAFLFFLVLSFIAPGQTPPELPVILNVQGRGDWDKIGNIIALGDVSGDSLPDLGSTINGKFVIYFGGKGVLDGEPDAELRLGGIACTCDLDGDGMRDLVLVSTANSYDTAWVYFGRDASPGELMLEIEPRFFIVSDRLQGGQSFGHYMACGDLNRDGFDDLVISARAYIDPAKRVEGKVFIYMGKPGFDGKPDFSGVLQDPPVGDNGVASQYGTSAQLADVNGDGYPDLIVGSSRNYLNRPGEMWKRLHIYRGGPNFTFDAVRPTQLIESRSFDFGDIAEWNLHYAKILDYNDDGLADAFVTHSDWQKIRSFVFLSTPDSMKLYPEIFIDKPLGSEAFFWDAGEDPGDINGDGKRDFAFRMFLPSVLVYYQGPNLKKVQHPFARSGPTGSLDYGQFFTRVGDQNGDGVDDVAAGLMKPTYEGGGFHILGGSRNLPVAIEALDQMANEPEFQVAYPNPFHLQTNIAVMNPRSGIVTLLITDALGRRITMLHQSFLPAGKHLFQWDGIDDRGEQSPSGIYFYRIITPAGTERGTLVRVR